MSKARASHVFICVNCLEWAKNNERESWDNGKACKVNKTPRKTGCPSMRSIFKK